MNKKSGFKWAYLIVLVFFGMLIMFSFVDIGNKTEKIIPTEVITLIDQDKVAEVYCYNGEGKILLIESLTNVEENKFPSQSDFVFEYNSTFISELWTKIIEYNEDVTKSFDISFDNPPTQASWLDTIMPILYILLGLFMIYFIFRMFTKSNNGAMSFGKSKARLTSNIKVKFDDIAGADEEKQELQEIVEFLKNPQKFTDLGARIPKGVLLVGNPGTGKTLLARAVAGESNVPFLSISGSDFVEMFVGVGASRVRDMFDQAKKSSPCIVFIDEIDAVGRQRGAGLGGGNDEREQTLNQLLVEMDGFEANEGIIVLAATNRSDVLDPALLRPGRFDRQIYVHNPDVKGREGIIKIHARNKPLDNGIDFQTLARITTGFTGADLENMLNEAAILAARAGRPKIIMEDITEGINKVIMGPQKRSLIITERDKLITAYHESGHAIIGKMLEGCEEIQEVSIIPRGNAAGYTMSRPDNDDNHLGKIKLNDTIAMMMGGRIAEELYMKDISTGASNDIKRATETARKMVTEWGMSDKFGFMGFSSSEEIFVGRDYQSKKEYSETTAGEIDAEVKKILDKNYERATKILKENDKLIKQMADLLIKKDTIYLEEINMLIEGKTTEEVIEYMDDQAKKRIQKEQEGKIELEKQRKIREIELRVKTAEMYLKNGIISQADYDLILKEKDVVIKKLEQDMEQKTVNSETPIKADKTEENEAKEEKVVVSSDGNSQDSSKSTEEKPKKSREKKSATEEKTDINEKTITTKKKKENSDNGKKD